MAPADSERLLTSAQLFPTGRICFLPLPRKDSASGKPGVLVEGCISRKQNSHCNRVTHTPSAASVDQPTVPIGTVRPKGKRLVKGVTLRDGAGTAAGIPEAEGIPLRKPPEPPPALGRD